MLLDRFGNPIKGTGRKHEPYFERERLTKDLDSFGPYNNFGVHKTAKDEFDWRLENFDDEKLCNMGASELINLLVSSSPDLSRARTDMQMYINTGYTLTVKGNDRAQEYLDNYLRQLSNYKEPLSVKLDKMVSSMFLKGALYLENVFNNLEPVEIRVLDPFRVAYREAEDEVRGQYKAFGEIQNGEFVEITSPYVQYIPVHARDDSPLGVPMVTSSIFHIVFLLGMMKAVRQILNSQAYPFMLVTYDREKVVAGAGGEVPQNIDTVAKEALNKVKATMSGASRNEIFYFGREVAMEYLSGIEGGSFQGIGELQRYVEKNIIRGLKQFPVIFGINEGNALSTNSTEQLEAHSFFINSLQDPIEETLNVFFTQILRAGGFEREFPVFRLNRTSPHGDRLKAEAFERKVKVIATLIENGIIDQQQGLDIVRDGDAWNNMSEILDSTLSKDAEYRTKGSGGQNNAEDESVSSQETSSQTPETGSENESATQEEIAYESQQI